MKRVLPFLLSLHLLVVGLLPGADTRILLDTAAAQEHHDKDHADSGFWDFVYDHFLGGEHHHADGNGHDSLPCHHDHSSAGAVVLFFQAPALVSVRMPRYAQLSTQPRLETPQVPGGVTRPCWQPPRA